MLISAKAIRHPRKPHRCVKCKKSPLGPHLLLYGTPDIGEQKPFTVRVCPTCVPQSRIDTEPKIGAALQVLRDAAAAAKETP